MRQQQYSVIAAAALAASVWTPLAGAAEPVAGYWTTSDGKSLKNSSGDCVRNVDQVLEYRQECGYELITNEAASVDTLPGGTAVTVGKAAAVVRGENVKASGMVIGQIVIPNVEFAFDSAELSSDFKSVLDNASELLKPHRTLLRDGLAELKVIGHTDSVGPTDYNQQLSERRARAVADHLIAQDPTREAFVTVEGRGETEPVTSNDTAEGRAQNRRVVLEVTRK